MAKKILALFLLLGLYLGLSYLLQPKLRQVLRVPPTESSKSLPTDASPQPMQAGESRSSKPESTDLISYNCEEGQTAYDLLFKKVDGQVVVKEYSFGKMVDTVGGLKGGTEGKFWIYFVEGKSATISADTYYCQNQEEIEWKFLKPQ